MLLGQRNSEQAEDSWNAQSNISTAKWLTKGKEDEKFHSFLSDQSFTSRFNVCRAPSWGGHFERLIGLFKSSF